MKRALLVALVVVAVGSTAAVAMLRTRAPALPSYGAIPDFTLTDADGRPFAAKQLDGQVWVADFIFTSCPEICPRMSEEMSRLQTFVVDGALANRVRLVSVSVDPDRDTPEKLRAYAHQFHARPDTWMFLTGSHKAIEDAVVHAFKIAVSREKDDSQDSFAIVHGTRFVLVDKARQIRGYYDPGDGDSMARLRRDLGALADRGAR